MYGGNVDLLVLVLRTYPYIDVCEYPQTVN